MQGINLHAMVRNAITAVHPDENAVLYCAAGQGNIDGIVKAKYLKGQKVAVQWQPNESKRLQHNEKINDVKDTQQVFLYANEDIPAAGIQRLRVRSGDMLRRGDWWYLIIAVIEDWSMVGWVNAEVALQTKAPDFSASDWHEEGEHGT